MSLRDQVVAIKKVFDQSFGKLPEFVFQAPGRVNLIGEHTDYNDGFVLPCAIDYQTVVAITPRSDGIVNVVAADYDCESDTFSVTETIEPHDSQLWSNYIRGVVKHLGMLGESITGADLVVSGNVPQGAGLSSSASLEVVVGEAFRQISGLSISKRQVALVGQEAENQFVGCNCGIMDQMVSACGAVNNAVLLDCRTLATQLIPMPEDLAVMIINSNVKRGLVDSEYNLRREQCEEAASIIGVDALRDANLTTLSRHQSHMSDTVFRRARHVVTENQRTLDAADALKHADYKTLSRLMAESHASMRDDFEITVPQIDYIVEILSDAIGDKGGVRMTGGGFGGCVVALLPHDKVAEAKQILTDRYQAKTGLKETVYICQASDGAGKV